MPSSKASTAANCARRSRPTCRPPSRRPSAAELAGLTPDRALVARFSANLDPLAGPAPLGLAVSGGPDSMALLLLATAARPGAVEALSVDHGLRPEAADEVAMVATLCARLGVPHHALKLDVEGEANVQARAREARYKAMAEMARTQGLAALATAHHRDDQAETLLMRLSRGAGLSGLAGIRPVQDIAGVKVVRPLLGWSRAELAAVCHAAGVVTADDPSNRDLRYDRAALRQKLAGLDLDHARLANSARHLADAEEALDWAVASLHDRIESVGDRLVLNLAGLPADIVRRLLLSAFSRLGAEVPRGPDLERAMKALSEGRNASLSGLLLSPLSDGRWRLAAEPPRRG